MRWKKVRVQVFKRAPPGDHIGEVGGEDGLVQAALADTAVGEDDLVLREEEASGVWRLGQAGVLEVRTTALREARP